MPGAALPDIPEQRRGFTLPGQTCELVDGRDDERRCQPVDLLVDGQDRKTFTDLTAFGERAARKFVTAVDEHPAHTSVGFDLRGGDGCAAPRAALNLQHCKPVRAILVRAGELLVCFLKPLRADVGAHPQPDTERFAAPSGLIGPACKLGRAHQCGGPLKLLGGQQPQGVAHQDRHPVAPVEWAVGGIDDPLATADREPNTFRRRDKRAVVGGGGWPTGR